MEITPKELRDIEIHSTVRGYDRDEVNELLERAAAAIDAANDRASQVQERLSSAQTEAGRTRETEDILHRTLLLAQRAADEAVAEATAKSRQMLDDAEIQSRRLVADAESDARRKGESERRRLEEEVLDLAGRRDALLADVEGMTRFEAEYRERMVRALEADLFALRSRPTSAPGTRPEATDVELPVMPEAIQRPEPTDVAAASFTTHGATGSATESDAPGAPEDAPVETSVPVEAIAIVDAPETDASATREVDVRSLFEQAHEEAAADVDADVVPPVVAATPAAPAQPAPAAQGLQPIDLLGTDGVDADVLDDDAFFATLRDAVHDDAPLGPRDENDVTGDHRFFDQDADRGSFRDVFRRRR